MTIKITRWSPDTCNCVYEYQWDDTQPPESRTHTLSNVISTCSIHSGLGTDSTKFNTVLEECQRKNFAHQGILDNGPNTLYDVQADGSRVVKPNITIAWSWSGTAPNRVLNVSIIGATLTTQQRNTAQSWLNTRFGVGKAVLA